MRDVIHDCYIDKFGNIPSEDRVEEIFNIIPSNIKSLAEEWGVWDTEVRENIFDFISR